MAQAGTLDIKNLSKQYRVNDKPLPVLDDISLSIKPGEFISIVGTSGCGKSTLLRLIIGLEGDYKDEILLDGQHMVGTSLDRGIVFQEHRLFPWAAIRGPTSLHKARKPVRWCHAASSPSTGRARGTTGIAFMAP
jgi:ABC-type nitrate/sulfonate/bicarbonate transport system ATPase subunit